MPERFRNWQEAFFSLRFQLIASLFLLLGFSITLSMLGIWTSERDRYMEAAGAEAMRAGRTIEKTLRSAMLENDWNRIQQSVDDVYEIVEPSMISIIGNNGQVMVSSEPSLVNSRFDPYTDSNCTICHELEGQLPVHQAIFMESGSGPVLRNIIKVPNAPECHGCHSPEQKNLGILIYDAQFGDTFDMMREVFIRTLLTSLFTFALLIIVLSLIIHRFVHLPLRRLMEGFIRVGRGDFEHWVEVDTRGEFQEMAIQFNVMSRAIGRSFSEIKRKNWETATLYAFVQQLSRVIEWRRLKQTTTELLFETFGVERAVLFLPRETKDEAFEVSWRQAGDRRFHHQEFDAGSGVGNLPDALVAEFEIWRQGRTAGPVFKAQETLALLPLSSKSTDLGLICLQRRRGSGFSEAEKKLIAAVGEQIGIALANARHYRLAITDGLTGLYTRRYGESVIRKFIDAHEADRTGGFSVLLLDLDNFKQVNDTHGHQVGDEVLMQLANLVRANIRYDDIACRYGGEEFVVLASGGLEAGWKTACRLRRVIERHVFSIDPALSLRNTVSIGIAGFPRHGGTGAEVIRAADQALYEAKKRGRNRVVCFEEGSMPPAAESP